jgi:hypothetical protein
LFVSFVLSSVYRASIHRSPYLSDYAQLIFNLRGATVQNRFRLYKLFYIKINFLDFLLPTGKTEMHWGLENLFQMENLFGIILFSLFSVG